MQDALPNNLHIWHFDSQKRGYMRCTVTGDLWTTDLRAIDCTDRAGGTMTSDRSFEVENGQAGAKET